MENLHAILSVKLILCCLGVFIHSVGIYALVKMRRRTDQVRILINQSVAEMLVILKMLAGIIAGFHAFRDHHYTGATSFPGFIRNVLGDGALMKIHSFIQFVALGMVSVNMMLLTTNRVVHTVLPFRLAASAQDRRIFQKLIAGSWIIVPLLCLLVIVHVRIVTLCIFVLTVVAVVVIIVCYVLIVVRVRLSRRALIRSGWVSNQNAERMRQGKKQMIPVLIIATFFLFYIIPYSIQVGRHSGSTDSFTIKDHLAVEGLSCVEVVGFISDAFIYIFFTKENRLTVKELLLYCCTRQNRVAPTSI